MTLTGLISEIIFYNSENAYTVCQIETDDEKIIVVGNLPFVAVGERISVSGEWVFHQEYGQQFKAEFFEKELPKNEADILQYLSSGIVKGVRGATAQKILDKFGADSLDIMADFPERLSEISGISLKRAVDIGKSYSEQLGVQEAVMFLQKYGISPVYAVKVYNRYSTKAVEIIKENPYVLAEEVSGIGFKTADKIAESMGIYGTTAYRVEAGARHCLLEAAQNGHTYLPKEELLIQIASLLNVSEDDAAVAIGSMVMSGKAVVETVRETDRIYYSPYYFAELGVARKLTAIASEEFHEFADIHRVLEKLEHDAGIKLAPEQREAVMIAARSGAIVITGGPGTGKTTIINMIIKLMEHMNKSVVLAAPTGRAAKRITELCGREASTIHRLLELGYSEGDELQRFNRGEDNLLEHDVIIVDEVSMVDMLLANALLKAVKSGTRLILVGDADQLPSVGAGDFLGNIISSNAVPVIKLTEIFRQAKESMIVVNAHKINHGEYPVLNQKEGDFFFMPRETPDDIINTIIGLCKERLPKTYSINSMTQIQVLTPMRRSAVGVNILNEELQKILNPPGKFKAELNYGAKLLRVGDKVMQIKNNYTIEWERDSEKGLGVFNGDVGYITRIHADEVSVLFDDEKIVRYDYGRLDELELAYAVTVHKSQGSEFEVVIMPMYPAAPPLQNRNLFYTAVTRARRLVVLVGRDRIIKAMVDSVNDRIRYCGLAHKLQSLLKKDNFL